MGTTTVTTAMLINACSPTVKSYTQADQSAERVFAVAHDRHAAPEQQHVQPDHQSRPGQAHFFTDDREDEVGGVFRQVAEFLDAVAQTPADQSALCDGQYGLDRVVPFA